MWPNPFAQSTVVDTKIYYPRRDGGTATANGTTVTSSWQTWNKPNGCTFVYMFMLASGGAGGKPAAGATTSAGGGGGSGGSASNPCCWGGLNGTGTQSAQSQLPALTSIEEDLEYIDVPNVPTMFQLFTLLIRTKLG